VDRQPDRRHWKVLSVLAAATWLAGLAAAPPGRVFFQETFDTPDLAARGWYDNTRPSLSAAEHVGGGGRSIEYQFLAGATKPTAGSPIRRTFGPSDTVYLRYHVKYSVNWVGSQKPYHPHEFHLLTTADDNWAGLSFTHLTVYVEQNGGTPLVAIQDGKNVDQSRVGKNLAGVTEHRAVAGCNGSSDGYPDNCYRAAEGYVNEKKWKAASKLLSNDRWHVVEVYVKLNTVGRGLGAVDGVVQFWLDGKLVIERRNVLLRTDANATMQFNQLVIAPYIGDGSPVAQSMWIDDVIVAAVRP
jgi:hypothetical protein